MATYGNGGGGVIPTFLAIMDRIKGRKFLNSPEGQAALAQFQSSMAPSPDLVSRAAKYPEVGSAFDAIMASIPLGPNVAATKAGTAATEQGTQQSGSDFTKLGMTPQAKNAMANQQQAEAQTRAVDLRGNEQAADFLQQLLGTTFDPKERSRVMQAGTGLQGPIGDIIRQLTQPAGADPVGQAILEALKSGGKMPGLNQPGGPIGPPLPPSGPMQGIQQLFKQPVFTPQGQQLIDRVMQFLQQLYKGGSPTPTPGDVISPYSTQTMKDLYR